jgi:hypothetical protein
MVIGLERQNSSAEKILRVLSKANVAYPVMAGGSAPGGNGSLPHVSVFDHEGRFIWSGRPADAGFEAAVQKALRERNS